MSPSKKRDEKSAPQAKPATKSSAPTAGEKKPSKNEKQAAAAKKSQIDEPTPPIDPLDEASWESFPASDAPAH